MLFFFIVFGIIGIQNFHGGIYNRCRLTPEPVDGEWLVDPSQGNFICRPRSNDNEEIGVCTLDTFCGNPLNYTYLDPLIDDSWNDKLIDYNTINFNDLWTSIVLVFEALTLSGWSTQMSRQIDAGNGIVAVPFFLLLISFGSYFILNLNLAVIMDSYSKHEQQLKEDAAAEAEMQKMHQHRKNLKSKASHNHDHSDHEHEHEHVHEQTLTLANGLKQIEQTQNLQQDLINHFNNAEEIEQSSINSENASCESFDNNWTYKHDNNIKRLNKLKSKSHANPDQDDQQITVNISRSPSGEEIAQQVYDVSSPLQHQSSHMDDSLNVPLQRSILPVQLPDEFNSNQSSFHNTRREGGEKDQSDKLETDDKNLIIKGRKLPSSSSNSHSFSKSSRRKKKRKLDLPRCASHEPHMKEPEEEISDEFDLGIFSEWYNKVSDCYKSTQIYHLFNNIVVTNTFSNLMLMAIALNTVSLSMDRYPITLEEANQLEIINTVCTWIFITEMMFKILGLGLITYFSDAINLFDAFVVIVSVVELVLAAGSKEEESSGGMTLTIFRAFRLLRVFRLARQWHSFHRMTNKMMETVKDIAIFFVLLLIIVLVFSLLGVELFSNYAKFDSSNRAVEEGGISPRMNFDNPLNGMVSVFVCLIGDSWNDIMHDIVRAKQIVFIPTLYFILLMVVGNLILMNLFLAILLKNFEDKAIDSDDIDSVLVGKIKDMVKNEEQGLVSRMIQNLTNYMTFHKQQTDEQMKRRKEAMNDSFKSDSEISQKIEQAPQIQIGHLDRQEERKEESKHQSSNEFSSEDLSDSRNKKSEAEENKQNEKKDLNTLKRMVTNATIKSEISDNRIIALGAKFVKRIASRKKKMEQNLLIERTKELDLENNSLCCFGPSNLLRKLMARIIVHPYFESIIFIVVILSCALIALEPPLSDSNSTYNRVIQNINDGITVFFLTELIMKVIVYGFCCNGHRSYMLNGWNILDFVIVATSILSFLLGQFDLADQSVLQNLELLKMLRVLRSMRLFSSIEGLRLAVLSLIYSLPGIFNVAVVTILFFGLFGIFFLNLFKGSFYNCWMPTDAKSMLDFDALIKTKYDCINYGGRWINPRLHFDSMADSTLSLFIISTAEGVVTFMNQATDAVGPGMQPQRDHNPFFKFVIILYMIFGSMFVTNLFIEVVIRTFDKEQAKIDRNFMLTNFQKEWIQVQLKCYSVVPKSKVITNHSIRLFCLGIAEWAHFDKFIMLVIIANALALCTVWPGISDEVFQVSETVQGVCTWIFILECVIKLIAYQLIYFHDNWNIFDFVVVVGGIFGMVFQTGVTKFLTVFRILRVCRVLRLLRKLKGLYHMFVSFINTIPAFANVGLLVFVMIFIFTSLGTRLFAHVMLPEVSGAALNKRANFQTFGTAFLTMIAVMTGEGWYELMFDLTAQPTIDYDCKKDPSYYDYVEAGKAVGCGSSHLSRIFFIIYVFTVLIVLVNLFVAVTLQGFEQIQREDSCRITDFYIESFIEVWRDYDPDGTGFIHISECPNFMRNLIEKKPELMPPKAKDLVSTFELLQELIEHLELKLYKKFTSYQFNEVLIAVAQMYLEHLASKPIEFRQILDDVHAIHGKTNIDNEPIEDLDDVKLIINDLVANKDKQVKMCKQLDQCIEKFRAKIWAAIDQNDGNFYNSSMISIIIKIQRIYRIRRQKRKEEEMEAQGRFNQIQKRRVIRESGMRDIKRQTMEKGEQDMRDILDGNVMNLKRRLAAKALDRMFDHGNAKFHVPPNIPHLQVVNSQESLMTYQQRHIKEMSRREEKVESPKKAGKSVDQRRESITAKLKEINRSDLARSLKKTQTTSTIMSIKREVEEGHSQIIQVEEFRPLRAGEVKMALQYYLRNADQIKSQSMLKSISSGVMNQMQKQNIFRNLNSSRKTSTSPIADQIEEESDNTSSSESSSLPESQSDPRNQDNFELVTPMKRQLTVEESERQPIQEDSYNKAADMSIFVKSLSPSPSQDVHSEDVKGDYYQDSHQIVEERKSRLEDQEQMSLRRLSDSRSARQSSAQDASNVIVGNYLDLTALAETNLSAQRLPASARMPLNNLQAVERTVDNEQNEQRSDVAELEEFQSNNEEMQERLDSVSDNSQH